MENVRHLSNMHYGQQWYQKAECFILGLIYYMCQGELWSEEEGEYIKEGLRLIYFYAKAF